MHAPVSFSSPRRTSDLAVAVTRLVEPQWRNRLAHGTYRAVTASYAGVASSSLAWGMHFMFSFLTFRFDPEYCIASPPSSGFGIVPAPCADARARVLKNVSSKNVERFTILRVILAQGPC